MIELDIAIGANWTDMDVTPHIVAIHALTDGVVDYVDVNVPYAPKPAVWLGLSTDAGGTITDWGLGAVGGSTDFIGLISRGSGDWVEYRYETGYSDPEAGGYWCCTGERGSASSDRAGSWSVSPTVVPLPGALPVLAGAIGLVGLIGYGRRRG